MGEAKQSKDKAPATVNVIVRANAHVDEAHTASGFVSKSVPLSVSEAQARRLLAAHPYLTISGE